MLSLVQVGGLVSVIAIGVPHLGQVDLLSGDGGSGGVVAAAALVFFAFIGFDEVITLAEETRDPTRTVPRALLLALGISTAAVHRGGDRGGQRDRCRALASSERPLADVLDHVLGGRGADVLAVVALMATTNTTLLCVTATSRLQYGMASAGALPERAHSTRTSQSRAPRVAIGVSVVVAAGFVALGDLTLVASVTDLAVYLVFVAVNVAVVVLRFRLPDQPRPFRTPVSIRRVPVLPIFGLLAVLVMIPALRWEAIVLGLGLCGMGLATYALIRRRFASADH